MHLFPEIPEEPAAEKRQEAASDFILFDMRTLTHFREEGPAVLVLSDTGAARMVLFALRAGQHVKDHRTSSQILIQTLRGCIMCTVADHSVEVRAGMMLQVEAHVSHSVLVQTDAVMLLIMTPSPSSLRQGLEHDDTHGQAPLVTRTPEVATHSSQDVSNG
jgi:quercetin dioxygenase-like cupin family protein